MNPALEVQQLMVNYEKIPVLWDISFTVPQGKLIAVVGPNGAGKSTLLKTALGLIAPLSGKISFFGEPLTAVRKKIAYIPQRESVDWNFPITVYDLVLMGCNLLKGIFSYPNKQDRAKVNEILKEVELTQFADRQISQLSGGQQQRAFLARALMQNADLYFLDEPFTGIDSASYQTIMRIMQRLRDQGKTFLIVHHELRTVEEIFDWVILLNMRLLGCGPVSELFTQEMIQKTYGKIDLFDEASRRSRKMQEGFRD